MRDRAVRPAVLPALAPVFRALDDRVVEKRRSFDLGPRKLSVELLPGDISEVGVWR